MGEILGIGCPHGPHPQLTDETMANNYFRHNLRSEKTDADWKNPENWPVAMREEWGDDEGAAGARRHRETLVAGFRKARAALDAFRPDVVVIFGDDQYENFKEDVIPPFCVYALDEAGLVRPRSGDRYRSASPEHKYGIPIERAPMQETAKGSKAVGTFLANRLTSRGWDVACSWKLHHTTALGHAFARTVDYLDWDRRGFPYPIIPFHVNCYGADMRIPTPEAEPATGRLMEGVEVAPPASPPPWRCYDLGKTVAGIMAESDYRVAIIGSSSWSHASLTNMHGHLWGDVDSDRGHYEELKAGEHRRWRDLDAEQMRRSGQHEMLNWICLAGAMEARTPEIAAYAESYIFNSSKCVAVFPA